MWSTPLHCGVGSEWCSAIVWASRKSSWRRASATTIAQRPSGVKYMLYGSSTGIGLPGRAVRGSIGVRLLPSSLVTYRVRRSHAGVTCWGSVPTAKWAITLKVRCEITSTLLELLLGTYTSAGSPRTTGLSWPAPSAAYALCGSSGGGIVPATVCAQRLESAADVEDMRASPVCAALPHPASAAVTAS